MNASASTVSTPAPSTRPLAAAPQWIWAVVAVVIALIGGVALGIGVRHGEGSGTPVPPLAAVSPNATTSPSAAVAPSTDGPRASLDTAAPAGTTPAAAPSPSATRSTAANAHRGAPAQRATGSHDTTVAAAPVCASCGVIEAVTPVKKKGEATGVGAVGGAVLGGLVGHQMGGGRGKDAMTAIGIVGGGIAGHAAEKEIKSTTVYRVTVRMDDGSVRHFERASAPAVGSKVTVDGSAMRLRGDAQG